MPNLTRRPELIRGTEAARTRPSDRRHSVHKAKTLAHCIANDRSRRNRDVSGFGSQCGVYRGDVFALTPATEPRHAMVLLRSRLQALVGPQLALDSLQYGCGFNLDQKLRNGQRGHAIHVLVGGFVEHISQRAADRLNVLRDVDDVDP